MKKYPFLLIIILLMLTVGSRAQYVNIPDSNFRKYLIQIFPTCFNAAKQMDTTCSGVLNADSIYCSQAKIRDLTGIQYFKNLKVLDCDSNKLTSLTNLPNSLIELSCYFNLISSITKFPDSLINLYCDYNKLTSLPNLPLGLKAISCQSNLLTQLPTLPNTIEWISCDGNKLTSLPSLPNSVTDLYCSSNKLTSLPALPNALVNLNCEYNLLVSIPTCPNNLYRLECGNNPITSLPILPGNLGILNINQTSIKQLPIFPNSLWTLQINYDTITSPIILPQSLSSFSCGYCNLDTLPVLPSVLRSLYCYGNHLTSLPILPINLETLYCDLNNLSYLPSLPRSLYFLNCSQNNIHCLPILPNNLMTLTIDTTYIKCFPNRINNNYITVNHSSSTLTKVISQLPICNATNNASQCQSFPTISGNVFYDQNNNGIKDTNEYGDAYTMVVLSNGEYAFTDTNGNYQFSTDTLGNFSEVVLVPPYIVPNPGIQSFTFNRYDTAVTAQNVALYSTTNKDSLSINITPLTLAGRPGGNFIYHVNFTNEGSTVLSPNIVFNYDNSLLTYTNSNLPSVANTGNSLTLNYNSLAPLRSVDFIISFKVKTTAQMGNVLSASASIMAASATATDSTSNVLVSSFDPNDKAATAKLTPTQVVKGDRIRYTIRFQNTGTASAINVVVADTLSSLLQAKTLDIIATSHPCKITMKDNIVYFEFLNINLPDSFHYKDLSHGFVTFSIKSLSTLTLGNMIPNTASIYFDYNKPVVTNTAKTVISNTVFPVNMAAFTASLINKESVKLNWVTAEEINTISFNIQQSANGRDFVTIGNEKAKGRGSYNYNTILTDDDSRFTKRYYRLEIIDKDGSKTYSEIRTVLLTNDDSRFMFSPNPAHSFLNIKGKGIVQVNIIDNMGRVVVNKKAATQMDEMKIELRIKPGVYVAQVIAVDGSRNNEKFIVE